MGIPLLFLDLGIPDEPPCYVRQCLPGSNAFLNWSDMSRGKFTVCVFRNPLQIHNCSSSGSLFFATLRQNN